MENFLFDSSKIQRMTEENKTLLQFTKNRTKFTIMRTTNNQLILNNIIHEQTSENTNDIDTEERNEEEDSDQAENDESLSETDNNKKPEVKKNLKRKIATNKKQPIKRKRIDILAKSKK